MTYYRKEKLVYYSKRYNKYITVDKGYPSDGATGAIDIDSDGWWVHDKLCDTGLFDDGTKCTNFQASTILSDILWKEKRWFRTIYWWPITYLFGGGKCRL